MLLQRQSCTLSKILGVDLNQGPLVVQRQIAPGSAWRLRVQLPWPLLPR